MDRLDCPEKKTLAAIEKKVIDIEKTLNGNGHLGFKLRIHDLEQYVILEKERRKEEKTRNWAFMLLAASNIAFIFRGMIEKVLGE